MTLEFHKLTGQIDQMSEYLASRGEDLADKLEIAFDKAGVKHVVARFVVAAGDAGDDVPF